MKIRAGNASMQDCYEVAENWKWGNFKY